MSYLSTTFDKTICSSQGLIDTADALRTMAEKQESDANAMFCLGAAAALNRLAGTQYDCTADYIDALAGMYELVVA